MTSVKCFASSSATLCHITLVCAYPWSSISGGPLPPARVKIFPAEVSIQWEAKPGKRSARSGIGLRLPGGNEVAIGRPTFANSVHISRTQRQIQRRQLTRCALPFHRPKPDVTAAETLWPFNLVHRLIGA